MAASFKVLLNHDHRAVEFFIRDKYEKRIYYSKNVTNGSSVCIGLQRASKRRKFFYNWGSYSLTHPKVFVCLSLAKRCEEGKREGFRQREQSVAQQGELMRCESFFFQYMSFIIYCFITSERGVQTCHQNQPRQDLRTFREPTRPW